MAAQASFDVTSEVELQEVDNAVNQAKKELAQRYDFKGSKASIDFSRNDNAIVVVAEDRFRVDAVWEILNAKLVKRGVPVRNLKPADDEQAAGGLLKRAVTLQQGIPTEAAKAIVKCIKDRKLKKVQASIQGDQVRISSPSKDELQNVMGLLKAEDFGVELQFGNYRG